MIRRFLDASSGHLSSETWDWLDKRLANDGLRDPGNDLAALIAGDRTRHGWFIDAPEDPPEGFPADLLTVLATARASGADYDCDAVRNQTLPIPHPDFRD